MTALLSKQMLYEFEQEAGPPNGEPVLYIRCLEREMGFEPTTLCLGTTLVPPISRTPDAPGDTMHLHDPRPSVVAVGRWLLPPVASAALAGLLIGGIGGRLAMLLLRITSGSDVIGLESDDGFTIGRFSADTTFLVLAATVGSALVLGPLYAIARGWIAAPLRSATFGALLGLLGGAAIVNTEGVDFTELSPRPLAVALFIVLPAAFGVALEPIHERIRPRVDRLPRWALMLWPVVLLPLLTFALPVVVAVVVVTGAAALTGRGAQLARLRNHPVVAWSGRVAFVALGGIAAVDLAKDINTLLL